MHSESGSEDLEDEDAPGTPDGPDLFAVAAAAGRNGADFEERAAEWRARGEVEGGRRDAVRRQLEVRLKVEQWSNLKLMDLPQNQPPMVVVVRPAPPPPPIAIIAPVASAAPPAPLPPPSPATPPVIGPDATADVLVNGEDPPTTTHSSNTSPAPSTSASPHVERIRHRSSSIRRRMSHIPPAPPSPHPLSQSFTAPVFASPQTTSINGEAERPDRQTIGKRRAADIMKALIDEDLTSMPPSKRRDMIINPYDTPRISPSSSPSGTPSPISKTFSIASPRRSVLRATLKESPKRGAAAKLEANKTFSNRKLTTLEMATGKQPVSWNTSLSGFG